MDELAGDLARARDYVLLLSTHRLARKMPDRRFLGARRETGR
jgi:hypothetical protein